MPLKVLLVDETPRRASALRKALGRVEGVTVACTVEAPLELLRRIEEHRPDIVLIDTESPSRDVLEQLAAVSSTAPRPVVVFTDDSEQDAIRATLRAGVSAYIVDGIAPGRLDPIMRIAMERFQAEQMLRAELEDTRTRLAERKVIERAKGLLMERQRFSEEQAYQKLRSMAMSKNLKLSEVAQRILDVEDLLG